MEGSNLWEDTFIEFIELSIEIFATEAGSEIASNYPIRVEHRYNMEDER